MTGRRTAGFTLIEVIVAFIILALVFGAVFSTFSTGLRNANLAGDYAGAAVRAQGKLDLLGVAEPLREGMTRGTFGPQYGWQQTVREIARRDAPVPDDAGPRLFEVTLTVFWGGGAHTLGRFPLSGGYDARPQELARIVSGHKAPRWRWGLYLDDSVVLRDLLKLPVAALENYREAAEFQIERQTPFRRAEVYFDCRPLRPRRPRPR